MQYSISLPNPTERVVADTRNIPFGVQPTEHMFIAEYRAGGWHGARIVPFSDLTISPLALCLHYGQTVFEGMKAFATADGRINIFRPEKHYDRFIKSLRRMCMPEIPQALFLEALHQLVQLDAGWMPEGTDGSLYLRPFMIATEARIGVKVSEEYLFLIVATPAYQYYSRPLKVKVETHYVRAAEGGTGTAKCGGNYGGAFYPTTQAQEEGYDQVLWTDSIHHQYIEESGTMNVMFYIDGTLITPPLSGTILDGVTRDSLLTIARDLGVPVSERRISYLELQEHFRSGSKIEAFGAGTAAVVAPIEILAIGERQYTCYTAPEAFMFQLQRIFQDMRTGHTADRHHWNYLI